MKGLEPTSESGTRQRRGARNDRNRYECPGAPICQYLVNVFSELLETCILQLEHEDAVRESIELARHTPEDFADHLIRCRNRHAGCRTSMTFDRRLLAAPPKALMKPELSASFSDMIW